MTVLSFKQFEIIFFFIGMVLSQEDPLKDFKCNDTDQTDITIGKNVTLCIHFQEPMKRMAFKILVDEYSVISIGGGFQLASTLNEKKVTSGGGEERLLYPNGQSFLAQIAKNITYYPTLYLNNASPKSLIPLFNLVIKVNEGVIYDIVWDNACFSCETTDQCFNGEAMPLNKSLGKVSYSNCRSESICKTTQEESFQCDPKFYITWFGTDLNKRQMKSSNLAMSKFRQYSIGSLYNSAKSVFNSTLDDIKKTWEEVKNAIDQI